MQVEDAKAGFFHTSKGRRAALAVAAGIVALLMKMHCHLPVSEPLLTQTSVFTNPAGVYRERQLPVAGICL